MTDALPPTTPADRAREAARRCESAGLLGEADILFRLAATIELEQRATSSASLARVLIAAGAVEEARPFAVAGNDPVLMAILSLETHDLGEARRLLDDARERDPFDPRSASARGRLSFFERRFPEAVADLLEAALLRPEGLPDADDFRFLRAARALASADFPGWSEAASSARARLEAAGRARSPSLAWPDRVPALVRALISRARRSEGLLDRARSLDATPGLSEIDDRALLAAAGAGEIRRISAGAFLYRAGEVAGEIYLVLSGAFELARETPVGPQEMGSVGVADFLGEECLVPGVPRATDARASSAAAVLGFRPDFLFESADRAPWLRHLRRRLAQRLTTLNLLFEKFFPGASPSSTAETPSSGEAASLTAAEKSKLLGRGALSESDRYLFGAFAEERRYPAEALIFREGDPGDALYAVASGRVRIARHIAGGEEALAILGPGEIFGEMAVLNPGAGGRSADARAHEQAVLLELGSDRFDRLEKSDPEGAAELSAMLCRLAARRCAETAERLGRWRIMAGPA
ncbi:MAG: cyclic nucleotide-binding domain-containing protein [Acidobacteriota bacterium]